MKKSPKRIEELKKEQEDLCSDDNLSEISEDLRGQTEAEKIHEYVKRLKNIEDQISVLKLDLKELDTEFKEKLDLKTLKDAIRVHKILKKIEHESTYEEFLKVVMEEMGSV